jgi:modification methylase
LNIVYNHSSEIMSEIQDNSIHLIVTSPPYPMIQKWDSLFKTIDFEEQHKILDKVWNECYRILIEGGICCINIGDATRSIDKKFQCYPNFARITEYCRKIGFDILVPIIWKKISNRPNAFLGSGFLPTNAYISQDCEYIIILRKGNIRQFKSKDENRINSKLTKEERDLFFSQIWNIPGNKGAKQNSSFPKEIPYRLIKMFSVINDNVLDPFSGTGTTQIQSINLNRNFIGYEINTSNNKLKDFIT